MKKRWLIATVVVLGVYSYPLAQSTVNVQTQAGADEMKSTVQGRSIALTNTLMSVATGVATVSIFENSTVQTTGAILAVYGIVMGPSTGNFYAEDYGRGLMGAAGRAAGVYLMADATQEIFGRTFADALQVDEKEVSLTDTRLLIGEVLTVASVIYNLTSINNSVEEYNSKRGFSMNMASVTIDNQITPVLTARLNF